MLNASLPFLSRFAALGLAACLAAPVAQAATISSTFDTGTEGWLTSEFTANSAASGLPTQAATGGNPGGRLITTDVFSWHAFVAGPQFTGDKSAFYGGNLSFDLRTNFTTSASPEFPVVILYGTNGQAVQGRGIYPGSGAGYVNYAFSLDESAWQTYVSGTDTAGVTPSQGAFQAILGSLSSIRISADFYTGDDSYDLDNFIMTSPGGTTVVPVPGALVLLGSGLGLLGFAGRARRSKA
jgi:hypothetical protein